MFVSPAAPFAHAQWTGRAGLAAAADEEAGEVVMAEGRVFSVHDAAAAPDREAMPSIVHQWHNAKLRRKETEEDENEEFDEAEAEQAEPYGSESPESGPYPSPAEIEASVCARDKEFAALTKRASEEDVGDALEEALALVNCVSGELLVFTETDARKEQLALPPENIGAEQATKDTKNLAAQMVALLRKGPVTRARLSSFFDVNRRRASTVLSILRGVGLVDEVRLADSKQKYLVLSRTQLAICTDLRKYVTMIHQLRAMRVRLMLHLGSLDLEARAASPPVRLPPAPLVTLHDSNLVEILGSPLHSAPPRHIREQPPAVLPTETELVEREGGLHCDDETFAQVGDSYLSLLLDDAALTTGKQCGDDDEELAIGHSFQLQLPGANELDCRPEGVDHQDQHEPLDIEYAIASLYDDLLAQTNHSIDFNLVDDYNDNDYVAYDGDDLDDTAQMMTDDLLCEHDQDDAMGYAEGAGDHLPSADDTCDDRGHDDVGRDDRDAGTTETIAAEASGMMGLDSFRPDHFCGDLSHQKKNKDKTLHGC